MHGPLNFKLSYVISPNFRNMLLHAVQLSVYLCLIKPKFPPFLSGVFTKLRKVTISFVMSVGQLAWSNSVLTGRILIKFYG